MKSERIYIELNPFLPEDINGYSIGTLHTRGDCPNRKYESMFRGWDDPHREDISTKVGRGAWIRVKKDTRCNVCYSEDVPEKE